MKVHHIAISVKSISESQEFYEKFGFTREKEFERKDLAAKAVFLKLEDMRIEMWEFEESKSGSENLEGLNTRGIRHIAFEVEDLDKAINSLNLNFSEAKLGASGSRYSFTKDPNGIPIELYEVN